MAGQLVDDALELAGLGFHLLPVVSGTKKLALPATGEPLITRASCDPEVVERWFAPNRHDVAIVPGTSRHAVADVDTKNGQPGASSLPHLEEQSGYSMRRRWSDVTATALSMNRGWHYFWRLPEGVEPEQLRGQLAPGVELKVRGLVVVPPSAGRRWHRHIRDGCLEMPPEMVALGRKPARAAPGHVHEAVNGVASIGALHKWLARRTEGERNNALYWAACRAAEMLERGEIGAVHAWMLVETAVTKLGLSRSEAESTVQSALGRRDLGAAMVAPPGAVVGRLLIPETGELVDAPARNGPVWEKIPRNLLDAGLSHGEFGLLVRIWLARNYQTGVSEATTQELAEMCGCDQRTVQRWLGALERDGWVTRAPGRYGGLTLGIGSKGNTL